MKNFIHRIVLFFATFLLLYLGVYYCVDVFFNNQFQKDNIFIWGDSQAYQGFDLKVFCDHTGKNVYTAAKHGAGIYDFLLFTEKVPDSSSVIVAISKPVQLRRKSMDRNRSGISLGALFKLWLNDYSFFDVYRIIKKNTKPVHVFNQKTKMFLYSDSIVLSEPVSLFENIYKEIPSYLLSKQKLFLSGINRLKAKHCEIVFIEFPYHPILQAIENGSPIKSKTEAFKMDVLNCFEDFDIDTIKLDASMELMHDLTHLNEMGAKEVSMTLGNSIKYKHRVTLYIVHWRNGEEYLINN